MVYSRKQDQTINSTENFSFNTLENVYCFQFKSKVYTMSSFKFFLMFLFIFETETEHEWGRGRERGRHRIGSRLQAVSHQPRAWRGAPTHGPQDHDLSWSQTLNRLSHPGAPIPWVLKIIINFIWYTCLQLMCIVKAVLTFVWRNNSIIRKETMTPQFL